MTLKSPSLEIEPKTVLLSASLDEVKMMFRVAMRSRPPSSPAPIPGVVIGAATLMSPSAAVVCTVTVEPTFSESLRALLLMNPSTPVFQTLPSSRMVLESVLIVMV